MNFRTLCVAVLSLLAIIAIGGISVSRFATSSRAEHPIPGLASVHVPTCSQRPPAVLATLGTLAAGHTPAELADQGFGAVPALVQTSADLDRQPASLPAQGTPGQLLVIVSKASPASVDAATLQSIPAIEHVATLDAQSADPSLRSCDNRLGDSPGAQALLAIATRAMVKGGYATEAQLDDQSTIFYISDDPIDQGDEFVTAILAQPVHRGDPERPLSQVLTPVAVEINNQTHQVLTEGYANWYAGQ